MQTNNEDLHQLRVDVGTCVGFSSLLLVVAGISLSTISPEDPWEYKAVFVMWAIVSLLVAMGALGIAYTIINDQKPQ